jgi:hypothetical protein
MRNSELVAKQPTSADDKRLWFAKVLFLSADYADYADFFGFSVLKTSGVLNLEGCFF